MSVLLDIFVLISILIILKLGYIRGIMFTLLRLVFFVLAFIISYFLADLLSALIYDNILKQKVISALGECLSLENLSKSSIAEFPGWLTLLSGDALRGDNLNAYISNGLGNNIIASVETAIAPFAHTFIRIVILPVFYGICKLALNPLRRCINKLFMLPVIGTVNRILGGICAIPISFLIISTVSAFLRAFSGYFVFLRDVFSLTNVNATFLLKLFYYNDLSDFVYNLLCKFQSIGG